MKANSYAKSKVCIIHSESHPHCPQNHQKAKAVRKGLCFLIPDGGLRTEEPPVSANYSHHWGVRMWCRQHKNVMLLKRSPRSWRRQQWCIDSSSEPLTDCRLFQKKIKLVVLVSKRKKKRNKTFQTSSISEWWRMENCFFFSFAQICAG